MPWWGYLIAAGLGLATVFGTVVPPRIGSIGGMWRQEWNIRAERAREHAEKHWPGGASFGERIAMIHSELSEALEGFRHGDPPSEHVPEFSAIEEEFADVVIRMMHLGDAEHLRIAEAIDAKLAFNETRPMKHGGKVI